MESEALSLSHNAWAARYFAIAIGAVMAIAIVIHWTGNLFLRYNGKASLPGWYRSTFYGLKRGTAQLLGSKIAGIHLEKLSTVFLYWSLHLILILTNVDLMEPSEVAKRLGWMTVANLVFLVFLALRHTPLAPLSGTSYEKLRPLHKMAGYTCILLAVVHALIWIITSAKEDVLFYLRQRADIAGATAALSMVLIFLSTLGLPRWSYETFYVIHVTLFMLILIMLGFHQPDLSIGVLKIVIFVAALWVLERGLRLSKLLWRFFGSYATLTPVNGAVRIKLNRSIHSRHAGSHAFLWLPSMRPFETHPFTMIGTDPVEFLVRPYDGFTRDLYNFACKSQESGKAARVRCSVDGPYGQIPDYLDFDRVILVAGGSGATFTFSIALDLIKRYAATGSNKTIDFIWTVKHHGSLDWFKDELKELQSPFVNLHIYVSQESSISADSSNLELRTEGDLEQGKDEESQQFYSVDTRKGRPDVESFINECILRADSAQLKFGIGACGPTALLEATRAAAMSPQHDGGPLLSLHTEEFEW
ncbi:hypothetical protein N7468_004023 [Penicillium chermesinum]|uniref:FAD-binding FR-type domain-containing protein n=1 Tax=Penicillium chermesinum TaxID=63820 RepID=A0A9W9P7J7_9EURO|nr:uncharacterized protein N7468_004023 [Penicillium chermesinum]KAJ5239404.1 hypothetical protein N7468_004023 [Penicillium chermesinum]